MLRTQAVLDIEDFCNDDYFRETYGDDWVEEHDRELEEEEEEND